jgi:hypothetical protein
MRMSSSLFSFLLTLKKEPQLNLNVSLYSVFFVRFVAEMK